jgi:hypothetical protein
LLKRVVDQLYKTADLDLQDDIKKINDTPRISASSHALEYWNSPGRNVVGKPKISVLRLHMVGDYQIPYTLMQGYMTQVAINKKEDLVRMAFVRSTGHCNYTAAESSAAIEIMMKGLNTGSWPSMEPGKLKALAASLNTNTTARFMPFDGYEVTRYNRAWIPR